MRCSIAGKTGIPTRSGYISTIDLYKKQPILSAFTMLISVVIWLVFRTMCGFTPAALNWRVSVITWTESVLKRTNGSSVNIFKRSVDCSASGCSFDTQKSRSSLSIIWRLHLSIADCSALTIARSSFPSRTSSQALIDPYSYRRKSTSGNSSFKERYISGR